MPERRPEVPIGPAPTPSWLEAEPISNNEVPVAALLEIDKVGVIRSPLPINTVVSCGVELLSLIDGDIVTDPGSDVRVVTNVSVIGPVTVNFPRVEVGVDSDNVVAVVLVVAATREDSCRFSFP